MAVVCVHDFISFFIEEAVVFGVVRHSKHQFNKTCKMYNDSDTVLLQNAMTPSADSVMRNCKRI